MDVLGECIKRVQQIENAAQTIRINQVQCCNEAEWPAEYMANTDRAWQTFNRLSEELTAELAKLRAQGVNR